ncbi:GyrI-like domain-containing protein [Bacillus alkalicellulosilyticus]|uniref:GyrI-like domain-containing protein n=1 Tax=Alkalihalobacterium alkalicellulosilyticum TaxID=1912214 RepID=UPI0009962C16|nr:effector binding domain-containing protein [Bacillus alkalicellulosilyticus]
MEMTKGNETKLITKNSFKAVGLKWEGTFAEAKAGGIRAIQQQIKLRINEIPQTVNPDQLLGLSFHAMPGKEGFTHYSVVEVGSEAPIPDGMVVVTVPSLTYACCKHMKGENISQSYTNLYTWIDQQGFEGDYAYGLTHFEEYPMEQDPYDVEPEFTMMIPVKKK